MDRPQDSAPGSEAASSATGGRVGSSDGRPVVLIVDDDQDVALALAETLHPELDARVLSSPREALAMLGTQDVAVLVSDLRMPEMGGIELLTEVRRLHPETVGVLMTAHADAQSAVQAINEARAFAYLVKPWESDALLIFIRRAVDAHRAIRRDVRVQQERELQILDQLSRSAPVPVTAERFGARPLRESLPDVFDDLLIGYAEVIDHALEQRAYKVDRPVSDALRGMADRLGAHRAGPRDVIDLHTVGMRRRLASASTEQVDAFAEEGRLLVLELMGHLVSYYRGYSLG